MSRGVSISLEPRSQSPGVQTLRYHFLTLFLGDQFLLLVSIPRVLCLQAASLPLSRALCNARG